MTVNPPSRRQSIAIKVLDASIDEIIRRSRLKTVKSNDVGFARVNILISTVQELNEDFYAKRGWQTTNVKTFLASVSGSVERFHIVDVITPVEY